MPPQILRCVFKEKLLRALKLPQQKIYIYLSKTCFFSVFVKPLVVFFPSQQKLKRQNFPIDTLLWFRLSQHFAFQKQLKQSFAVSEENFRLTRRKKSLSFESDKWAFSDGSEAANPRLSRRWSSFIWSMSSTALKCTAGTHVAPHGGQKRTQKHIKTNVQGGEMSRQRVRKWGGQITVRLGVKLTEWDGGGGKEVMIYTEKHKKLQPLRGL